MATSSRMLVLLSLLQARRDWPGQLLAERLDISERTVRRDVERLRELGYRIRAIKGPDGGYRLDAGSELPPLLFDDEQAVVLALALQTVNLTDTALQEASARALVAVRQVMPARLRHRIDAVQVTALPFAERPSASGQQPGIGAEVLVALGTAVCDGTTVRFDYVNPQHPVDPAVPKPPREVQPHGLVAHAGHWYLVAWSPPSDDWRTYRIDRLTLRAYTGPRFAKRGIPGGSLAGFVAGRFRGATDASGPAGASSAGSSWPCEGSVVLSRSVKQIAPYIGDGTAEQLGPQRTRVTLGAWSWIGLAGSIARFDAEIEQVSPPELAAAFATLGRRLTAAAASG